METTAAVIAEILSSKLFDTGEVPIAAGSAFIDLLPAISPFVFPRLNEVEFIFLPFLTSNLPLFFFPFTLLY